MVPGASRRSTATCGCARLREVSIRLREWAGPLGWGLFAGVAAFVPMVIGLLTANPPPGGSLYGFALITAVVVAVAGAIKTRSDGETIRALQTSERELSREKMRLAQARADTQQTLSLLGAALLGVARRRDDTTLNNYVRSLLDQLHTTLSDRAPCRVYLMQTAESLGDDRSFALRLAGSPVGHRPNLTWTIAHGTREAELAREIMARKSIWSGGSLLQPDVRNPRFHLLKQLAPPDHESPDNEERTVVCWCRTAVASGDDLFGLLCVDVWDAEALSGPADESLVDSFATLLTTGFLARRSGIG